MPITYKPSPYQEPKKLRFLMRKLGYDPKQTEKAIKNLRVTESPGELDKYGYPLGIYRRSANEIFVDPPPTNPKLKPGYLETLLHETQHAGHAAQGINPYEKYRIVNGTAYNDPGAPHILWASDPDMDTAPEKKQYKSLQQKLMGAQNDNLTQLSFELGVGPKQLQRVKDQIKNVYTPDINRRGLLQKQAEEEGF